MSGDIGHSPRTLAPRPAAERLRRLLELNVSRHRPISPDISQMSGDISLPSADIRGTSADIRPISADGGGLSGDIWEMSTPETRCLQTFFGYLRTFPKCRVTAELRQAPPPLAWSNEAATSRVSSTVTASLTAAW